MIEDALRASVDRRQAWLATLGDTTTCVRLLHGAVEGVPGLTIDRYGPLLLIQTWREPLDKGVPEHLAQVVHDALGVELVPVWNHRAKGAGPFVAWHQPQVPPDPVGLEHGLTFDVQPRHRGQDPLLFLDFRVGRRAIRERCAGQRVLNLFSYTCGIGVAAAVGGAKSALNVDFAESALAVGRRNAEMNGVEDTVETLHFDALPVLRALAGVPFKDRRGGRRLPPAPVKPQTFDCVVLDPPRWARSKYGAVDVVRDYASLFKPAVLCTEPGGAVLATNHVPQVDLTQWLDALRRCAAKAGRPLADIEVLPVDPDVPSSDGAHPLKLAWCTLQA
ncbi:MAG: class I SAM-dependent rRNA methyltransferase [Myxococcota bacterium]